MSKIEKGNKAIGFDIEDINGNNVSLQKYQGQKVFISFFRKASCPFCNMGVQQLIKRHKEFEEKGIKVITLFASSKNDVMKYAGKQQPPFSIIADGDFKIYEQYGLETSMAGMLKTMVNPVKVFKAMTGGFFSMRSMVEEPVLPADILIDENQIVYRTHYGKGYDDHLSLETVLDWESAAIAS